MIIEIKKENCLYLKDISFYNNNYFKLPFTIWECDILFEKYSDEGFDYFCLCKTENDKPFEKLYLNTEPKDEETFIIDSDKLSIINSFT